MSLQLIVFLQTHAFSFNNPPIVSNSEFSTTSNSNKDKIKLKIGSLNSSKDIKILEATLALTAHSKTNLQLLNTLSTTNGILKSTSLFSREEKSLFAKLKMDYLGSTLKLRFKNEASYLELKRKIKSEKIPVHLDPLDLQTKLTATDSTNDPLSGFQWSINNQGSEQTIDLDLTKAYRVPARSGEDIHLPNAITNKLKRKIRVAVLDTGIDFNHPDLKGAIARNEVECKALEKFKACLQNEDLQTCGKTWFDLNNPEVDQDKNGYPLDCSGWSVLGGVNPAGIMGRPDFTDEMGHGTHVSGLIAALKNNNFGIQGVSSNVEIIPIQVIGNNPLSPVKPQSINLSPKEDDHPGPLMNLSDYVARGVLYAINANADIMSFSLGWPHFRDSDFMKDLIAEAIARGIIVVAAAGNDSTEALIKPCAYPGVICVGALNPDGAMAHFSNFGTGVDIAAPGTNILSTFPTLLRPINFRSRSGFEFMHGTSQATPIVAGSIAEMLAAGISKSEIRARIIAGARPLQTPFEVQALADEDSIRKVVDLPLYAKTNLGGQLDVSNAINIKPVPVIVPSNKDNPIIEWDTKATRLNFPLQLQNIWQDVSFSDVKIVWNFRKGNPGSIRPKVIAVDGMPTTGNWQQNQIINLNVIADFPNRSPYNPELMITVTTPQSTRKYSVLYDIVVPIGEKFTGPQMHPIESINAPTGRTSWLAIDENFDTHPLFTDYFVADYSNSPQYNYSILSQDRNNTNGAYINRGTFNVEVSSDNYVEIYEHVTARIDNNYAIGIRQIYKGKDVESYFHSLDIYLLSQNAELLRSYKIDAKNNEIPQKIRWMNLNSSKVPAWFGFGKDPDKVLNIIDYWDKDKRPEEKPEARLYYFTIDGKLKALQKFGDYKIVDILNATSDQILQGRLQILLAKNLGTSLKPSYMNIFARAEVINGKIINFVEIKQSKYRNILDASIDQLSNLDPQAINPFSGTFWFGPGINKDQYLTVLSNNGRELTDFNLPSLRNTVDAALKIRAVFGDQNNLSAFVMTNSELQFHDLNSGQIAFRSLERYTYIQDEAFTSLHFPMLITDSKTGLGMPSLYITQSTEFSKALKVIVPAYDENALNQLNELSVPAKLRFRTDKGCKLLETPTRYSNEGVPSLDLLCQDKLFRIELSY